MSADDADPVPRIPRPRGFFKVSMPALVRIVMTAALLTMIVMTQRPCADAVSGFVTEMDGTGSGAAARQMPKPGTVDVPRTTGSAADYEQLTPGMSEAEIKAAIERAKTRAAAGQGGGSAGPAISPPGTAGSNAP